MTRKHTLIPRLDDLIPDVPADSIVSRTVFEDELQKVVLFAFAEGEELSEHTAASPAVLYFISGEADLTLGEEQGQAGPGTWVHMAPNLPHSIQARSELRMLLTLFKNQV